MISGKLFAESCRWVVDPRYPTSEKFNYSLAKDGDRVFINGDNIHDFLAKLFGIRTKRYVLFIHNSDRPFGVAEFRALIPYAYHIYAINTSIVHPYVTTIPIGFVDRQLPILRGFIGGSKDRTIDVYVNFIVATNTPKRLECLNALANDPRVTRAENRTVVDYFTDLGRSKFVVCPEGTGFDTHRVYESLLCGATPVVLHGPLDSFYETLAICIVDKWTDPFTVPEARPFRTDISAYIGI